jgi:hypothetical protein
VHAGLVGCDSRTRPVAVGDPALAALRVEVRTRRPGCVVATTQSSTDPTTALLTRKAEESAGNRDDLPAVARTNKRARPTRSTSCSRTST